METKMPRWEWMPLGHGWYIDDTRKNYHGLNVIGAVFPPPNIYGYGWSAISYLTSERDHASFNSRESAIAWLEACVAEPYPHVWQSHAGGTACIVCFRDRNDPIHGERK